MCVEKKNIFFKFIFIIFFLCISTTTIQAKTLEEKKQDTLKEIENLKSDIKETQKEINSLTTEKNDISSYINQLDNKIIKISNEISDFEDKIEDKEKDIEETKVKLEDAKVRCEQQYDDMQKRIQFIYEKRNKSFFEMIVSSNSISDLLNKADYVFSMSDYDNEMMNKLNETKKEIENYEKTLEQELSDLELMKSELESQKTKVNSTINAKKGELAAKNSEINSATKERSAYEKELEAQEKILNEIEEQIAKSANGNAYEGTTTGFVWPCPGYTRISSYFGPRPQPTPGASTNHKGVDLAAPYGSNILATAAGKVTTSTYSKSAGNYIVIAHGNGMSSVYMHCSKLLVSVGDTVSQGQVIAKVGSTGYSTGNHLHFGIIKNGSYVNPLNYI